MKNAVYGETTENVRNRVKVKLVSNKKKLFKVDILTNQYIVPSRNVKANLH